MPAQHSHSNGLCARIGQNALRLEVPEYKVSYATLCHLNMQVLYDGMQLSQPADRVWTGCSPQKLSRRLTLPPNPQHTPSPTLLTSRCCCASFT